MIRAEIDPPSFGGGVLVPVATYALMIAVLSGLALVAGGRPTPPLLGVAWGILLVTLGAGAFIIEDVSPRSMLPAPRPFLTAIGVVGTFWLMYNLVGYGLAVMNVSGFATVASKIVGHPVGYVAAFMSSLLFTALPEEFVFRGYLQSKLVFEAGGSGRRAATIGVIVAAVLFTLFHLPRWFLLSGHGVGPGLVTPLLGWLLAGLAYGVIYLLTNNLWLVALLHGTMNQPLFLLTVDIPTELHLMVGLVEYTTMVLFALGVLYITGPASPTTLLFREEGIRTSDD